MKTYLTLCVSAFLFTFIPLYAYGATLSLSGNPEQIGIADTVNISITIESTTSVNAFQGTLIYNPDDFQPLSVSDGNSIISGWIIHPSIQQSGKIQFAGIVPGGYQGKTGELFSVQFRALKTTTSNFNVDMVKVLRNDGLGTNEPTNVKSLSYTVAPQSKGGYILTSDSTPPEDFKAYLTKDIGGHSSIVFQTTDKGSGIDHYEVAETRFNENPQWNVQQSPYTLHDQYGTSDISIKAVDRAGNIRISIVRYSSLFRPYEIIIALILVLIGIVAMTALYKKIHSHA